MKVIVNFLKEVKIELEKVTWPKRNDVVKLTATVIIFSAIVGFYVGGLDFVFTKMLEVLFTK